VNERPAGVFLDRDGTLNEEVNFVRTPDDLRLIEGAGEAVRRLNERGLVACVISNQSGVARGYLREEDLVSIHARLEDKLAEFGARLDHIYYCPHHPTAGVPPYNVVCDCRKPKPKMLQMGIDEFGIDSGRLFVVGDSVVDIQAGNAVGATTILVRTGYGNISLDRCTSESIHLDFVVPTIVEAVDTIVDIVDGKTGA
jgi:D-glycero-D-manno-heptose 1,7-bisphosphate phosphatase